MKLELIESDFNYYKESNKYSYEIKSYANDYELLTFYYLKYNYRKFIEKYNNKNTLSSRKAIPIQVGMKLNYLGYSEIYFIDRSHFLPRNKDIAIIQIIGPGDIKDETLYLYDDLEKVLKKYDNKTYSIYYYHDWDTNNTYKKIKSNKMNMQYNVFDNNIITNKIKKKDYVYCLEVSLLKKNKIDNELKSFPLRLKFITAGLNILKKEGTFIVQYFNCSEIESLLLMISIYECFTNVEFNRSKLRVNTLEGGFYVFENYNGKNIENIYNNNKKNISNIKNILNHEFIKFINKNQKDIYKKYNIFLKKCELISNSRKPKSYFENYQISIGIDWCNENNVLISDYYQEKLYKETSYNYLKKIFYPEKINYKRLKLYYDSFYSVTYYKDYLEIIDVIKKYFPKEKIIVDACSNVGASTISLSYDFIKVFGIEIDKYRYQLLENNVKVYNKKNIKLINDDYLNLSKKYYNYLTFFDPPWSGIYYKIDKNIELYLGNTNIKQCLNKKYVMKAPFNFNYHNMKNIHIERLSSFLLIIKNE
jgi:16S rRNA G966 N2-methylase RsmD